MWVIILGFQEVTFLVAKHGKWKSRKRPLTVSKGHQRVKVNEIESQQGIKVILQ